MCIRDRYNTPGKYLREFLDSFVNQTAPNGQLCLADASDAEHADVKRLSLIHIFH